MKIPDTYNSSYNNYDLTYIFPDNNGNVRVVIDSNNNINKYDYKPFGELYWSSDGSHLREGLDGSIFDPESELQMMGFRMYDTETGRFTTPDLLWAAFPSHTPYHYAYNSPLIWSDPSGLAPEKERDRERLLNIELDWEGVYNVWNELQEENDRRGSTRLTNADGSMMLNMVELSGNKGSSSYKGDRTGCVSGSSNGASTKKGQPMNLSDMIPGFTGFTIANGDDWSKMNNEQKNEALNKVNNLLRYLQSKSGYEWSYTLFEVENKDGTSSIIVSNFKTDGESNSVMPDFQYKGNGSLVKVWGFGHSHPTNSPHSAPDLGFISASWHKSNGFLSLVVSPDHNFYLEIVDHGALLTSWSNLIKNDNEDGLGYTYFMINYQNKGWTDVFKMDNNGQCHSCGLHFEKFTPKIRRK
ncbi:hypothetical protein MASR1M45_04810 [Candidatus Kapaibacterium sp.]